MEGLSRRGSGARGRGGGIGVGAGAGGEMGGGTGVGWQHGRSGSRRDSVERGGRIAETGTLVPRSRSRAESQGVASTRHNNAQVPSESASANEGR